MLKIYSKAKPGLLLHIVHRKEDFVAPRDDIVNEDQFIQLACLRMDSGKTFKPHRHVWKPPFNGQTIAQESWVVISGAVKCYFYDIDDSLLEMPVLNCGDCSITLEGGHTYEILEDNTLVYEYKTGPYMGQKHDKVFLNAP